MDREFKKVMLISPDVIKASGDLNINVDDEVIGASIRASQNIYLRDVIGDKMLDKLQELVYRAIRGEGDNIEEPQNSHYKVFLDEYMKEALTYKVLSEICVRIALKIRNAGVVQLSDTNVNPVTLSDIKYLRGQYETYYCDKLNRLTAFLRDNKKAFPEMDSVGCDDTPKSNAKYGNTGLWLGK